MSIDFIDRMNKLRARFTAQPEGGLPLNPKNKQIGEQ
jgi:hypothetical protein